ncbi:MAG TPA: IS21 family transposase, partial [Polyangiales bacterium]|nr:IS21 family transposase [Polyangiales bacterium]
GCDQPLTLIRVQELLVRDGIEVPYTTLRRYAHAELGWKERRPSVRVDDPPPGEEAQVDFGQMGYVTTAQGQRRKLHVLIVTLSMSRYQYVYPTFVQTVEALCDGLDAAWRFFGGVVKRVVLDNMSAAVLRASAQSPQLNPSFAEYAQARGFFVDPARVRRPQDKARVENQVPFVRERWFAGESFDDDLYVLRASAEAWCRDVAGARVHGTTRQVPREVFEQQERSHLLPAPTVPFDVPRWSTAKVHPDHHVSVGRSLYSVPTAYLGRTLRVRADRSVVRMYLGQQLIKSHARVAAGKRSTDPADYPVGTAPYARRSIDGLVTRAREIGQHVGAYAERLLDGPLPWTRMRQAYALLRLCDRYGSQRVEAVCARALAFDVIDVPRIERMLKAARSAEDAAPSGRIVPLPQSRFARDPASFATLRKGGE